MRIFLDHQAATPLLPEVREGMEPWLRDQFGNPSSLHSEGLRARDALAKSREQIAGLIHAETAEGLIFTGNGTEAVNLAVKGAAFANQRRGKHIILSAAEHPATVNSVSWLEQFGFSSTNIPVDSEGRIDPEAVRASIRDDTILVCVHHANHDIGTVQDVERIGAITSEHGIPLFVDAVASAGWIEIDVQKMHADLLAVSPSRFYGPKGVGVLYRHRRARIQSLIHGGDQEEGRRAGTENVAGIVGAGVSAEVAERDLASRQERARRLQQKALALLMEKVRFLKLNGPSPGPGRHPANLNLSVEFVEGEGLALMLDVKGVSIAAGAACVTKNMRIPPALAAIGLPESLAKGNVILSFGKDNTEAEIDFLAEIFTKTVDALREISPSWDDFQRGLINSQT